MSLLKQNKRDYKNPYFFQPEQKTMCSETWWNNKYGDKLDDGYSLLLATKSRAEFSKEHVADAKQQMQDIHAEFANQLVHEMTTRGMFSSGVNTNVK